MAVNQYGKLYGLYFFGITYNEKDKYEADMDMVSNIRRKFILSKKPASNKLYRHADGVSYVYSYNVNPNKALGWKVTRNKQVVQEVELLSGGKYCIIYRDSRGIDFKRVHFDENHNWTKSNYYNAVIGGDLICSFLPKEYDEGTAILKYTTGENYPDMLFPLMAASCDTVKNRVFERVGKPSVTALTDRGVVYFANRADKEAFEIALEEEEARYADECGPSVFVTVEDVEGGFDFSVKDFDMKKNLNRTFDISLASEFSSEDEGLSVSEPLEEEATDAVYDTSETPTETESEENISVDELHISENATDVDSAIADVIEQININTSLGIDADKVFGDVSETVVATEDDDTIKFSIGDSELNQQLEHIDSVLDSADDEEEKILMVGESVVDEDYISKIIDEIMSAAFVDDAKGEFEAEPETEIVSEEAVTADEESFEEQENTESEPDNEDLSAEPEASLEEAEIPEETGAEEMPDSEEYTEETAEEPVTAEAEETVQVADEAQADEDAEVIESTKSADSIIKENPASSVISSGNNKYYYYGTTDENGNRQGKGRTFTKDGDIAYEGSYLDDKRHGFGCFYYKDNALCYAGNWDKNIRSGFGMGINSENQFIHVGNWQGNKPSGLGARFDNEGNLMFVSTSCEDKKKGFTISDLSDDSFTLRVWDEREQAFIQQEIKIKDILK